MNLKNPEKKYRPIPFWSWNEKLDTKETKRQIEMMDQIGMGGYFMHARGGLQTEYMGREWFDNVEVGVVEGKKHGMSAWAYDENGWPSGFGNGLINGMGLEYQQKYLRMEEGDKQTEFTICNKNGIHFYYEVNPFYVDTLYKKGTLEFIDKIYKPYYEKYKNDIEGFFTDEPQISRNGIPWSFILPDEYEKAYGENLLDSLIELFRPVGNYKDTRFKFWKLVTDLFSENFMKPIYDWCNEHELKLTGHLVIEEDLERQLVSAGACMPHYEYFHIPGVDWLTRNIYPCLTHHQVSSVAHQLGKNQILTESFALCGHNVGMDELKRILEWQMVRGINILCPHLQGYSLRGIRKRDYPPAMYYQQPWWEEYGKFIDAMSRIGMLLAEGRVEFDTLVIHPQSSAWVCFDNGDNEGLNELHNDFISIIEELEKKHVLFHFGDEIIMNRHAKVVGNKLVIGTQSYSKIVLPRHEVLFDSTKALLEEFKANGGVVINHDELVKIPCNSIIDNENITYTKRVFEGYTMHYFVNTTEEVQKGKFSCKGKVLDIETGEFVPFYGEHTFGKYESLVVIDDGSEVVELKEECKDTLPLSGAWEVVSSSENSITLDFCDYYFDGELIEKNGYVLNILNRALKLKRPVKLKCEYSVDIKYIPEKMWLATETPDVFDIFVNGQEIEKRDCGYFVDIAFRKIEISKYLIPGKNTITFETELKQSEEVYENLEKSYAFESEKNKLTFDMEIEPIYLVGDFSVVTKADGITTELNRDAFRYSGGFVISSPAKEVSLQNIEKQGFMFFAGRLTVKKKFILDTTNYRIRFNKKGISAVKIRVNGSDEKLIMWEPQEYDISDLLKVGENEIEITIVNNLRNLMGPHHLEEGETYAASPRSFYKESCVWNKNAEDYWNEDYCFVEMSLFN